MLINGKLVGCFEDLRRFSDLSAISRLGAGDNQSEIVVARPGIEPQTSCSASQELNHYTTAAPNLWKEVESYLKDLSYIIFSTND